MVNLAGARHLFSFTLATIWYYPLFYNNPSYSRILIGSCLWSNRGQMHDWRHHYRVFTSAVLKWRNVLRIKIMLLHNWAKDKVQKSIAEALNRSKSRKKKEKAISFRTWSRKNSQAVSVGSLARLNHAQNWPWKAENHALLYLEFNKPNKQNASEINLFKKFNFSQCQNNCWHTDRCQEWNIKTSLLKIR